MMPQAGQKRKVRPSARASEAMAEMPSNLAMVPPMLMMFASMMAMMQRDRNKQSPTRVGGPGHSPKRHRKEARPVEQELLSWPGLRAVRAQYRAAAKVPDSCAQIVMRTPMPADSGSSKSDSDSVPTAAYSIPGSNAGVSGSSVVYPSVSGFGDPPARPENAGVRQSTRLRSLPRRSWEGLRMVSREDELFLSDRPSDVAKVPETKPRGMLSSDLPMRLSSMGPVACPCCLEAHRLWRFGSDPDGYARPRPNVARSNRRTATDRKKDYESKCRQGYLAPHAIIQHPIKGRAVITTAPLEPGDYVTEYGGQLVTGTEAEARERQYADHPEGHRWGCYTFFFTHNGQSHAIDATAERAEYCIGRYLSHSRRDPNLQPIKIDIEGIPHIILVAKRPISAGEELQYEYGEQDKEALEAFPFLEFS